MELRRRGASARLSSSSPSPCAPSPDPNPHRTRAQDPETHRITDVFSFYHLPSTAIQASPPARVEAAYLYFYATTAAPSCADLGDGSVAVPVRNWKDETEEERKVLGDRLKALMGDALTLVSRVRPALPLLSACLEVASLTGSVSPLQAGFDVLNTLTIQDNSLFLEELKVRPFQLSLLQDLVLTHPARARSSARESASPSSCLPSSFPLSPLTPLHPLQRLPPLLPLVRLAFFPLAPACAPLTRAPCPACSNYATKPVLGGIDPSDGGSGVGVIMLCASLCPSLSFLSS